MKDVRLESKPKRPPPPPINVVKLSGIANNIQTDYRKCPTCKQCLKWFKCPHKNNRCTCERQTIICNIHHNRFSEIIMKLHRTKLVAVESSSNIIISQLLHALRSSYPVVVTVNSKTKNVLDTPANNTFLSSNPITFVLVVNCVAATYKDTNTHLSTLLDTVFYKKLIMVNFQDTQLPL